MNNFDKTQISIELSRLIELPDRAADEILLMGW
jgi:hypothetical protein